MRRAGAAIALCLITALPAAAAESVTVQEIKSFAAIAGKKGPDPFAPLPDEAPMIGRQFRLEFPANPDGDKSDAAQGNYIRWSYDPRAQVLTLKVWPRSFTPNFKAADRAITDLMDIDGFTIDQTITREPGGTRSNAYGVAVEVQTEMVKSLALATFAEHRMGGVAFQDRPTESIYYTLAMPAPPDEARRLSIDIRVVIEGEIVPLAPGRVFVCGSSYFGPTINNPKEHIGDNCFISARFTRLAIMDSRSGSVLKEWR